MKCDWENNEILFISQKDLLAAGALNFKRAFNITKNAIFEYGNGHVLSPDKVVQIFDDSTQNRINCLPATLLNKKICGMKWVSVFPENPIKFNKPNVSSIVLLSEITTGYPISILEGAICSNIRTASISAVAAQYLACKNPMEIGFVGAGEQSKMHFLAMKSLFPSLKRCKVYSRTRQSETSFVKEMSKYVNDVDFKLCEGDASVAVKGSDIFISAISSQVPLIKSDWIKPGALYCHVGGWEDEEEVAMKADKIVCDSWDGAKHRSQTISRMYKSGKLSDHAIYADIDELVTGKMPGRESEQEFIYMNVVGLSYVDVAIAYDLYELARSKGIGTSFSISSTGMFSYDKNLNVSL